MRNFFLSISLLFLLTAAAPVFGQSLLPEADGQRARFTALIEMPRGYISGVCAMTRDEGTLKGCLFNEFGISAIDFTYNPQKDKVKLLRVMAMLDRWYVRRVLRKDLRALIHAMQRGESSYKDEKHNLSFQLTPLADDPTP